MSGGALLNWADVIGGFVPRRGDTCLVDVGSGTGVLTAALALRGAASFVLGLEPSPAMLRHARPGRRVRYVQGSADALPVRSSTADGVLLSRVVHHLSDRRAGGREFARVSRPAGRLVIRTTIRERLDAIVYQYFPELLEIDRLRFPSLDELERDFGATGWVLHAVQSHAEPVAEDLTTYRNRIAHRAQSKFSYLGNASFAAGMARLSAAAERQDPAQPVYERYDVIVFERAPGRGAGGERGPATAPRAGFS